eukprot:CAMPEP_0180426116 /NCGR_PEP_ID=MMETSP1036_2-20121128/5627_1 /TAXON_ID=632150 /ORGANISM="Azadinium spinosum, Strain 3D9" /LENGTH=103 /DNA_ID=CAMNT_0022431655 /DNA_START=94 /DNA_END=405 /DNA_ORIENTATION=+
MRGRKLLIKGRGLRRSSADVPRTCPMFGALRNLIMQRRLYTKGTWLRRSSAGVHWNCPSFVGAALDRGEIFNPEAGHDPEVGACKVCGPLVQHRSLRDRQYGK